MNLFKSIAKKITALSGQPIQFTVIPEPQKNDDPVIAGKSLIIDPYYEINNTSASAIKTRTSRISNEMLREVSQRDWLIASILRVRCDTIASFANYSNDPLKPSYHFVRRDGKDTEVKDEEQFRVMASFLENVGFTDNVPYIDRQNLQDFVKQITRDILVYGYASVEKIYKRDNGIHRFRARPSDSFYYIDGTTSKPQMDAIIQHSRQIMESRYRYLLDPTDVNQVDNETYHYCQTTRDGRISAVFGESDLIWKNFGFQSGSDSVGYPISHLEQALKLTCAHMNIDNYNEKIFTNGYAAKGILHLKGQMTQEQLIQLRRQFHESVTGTENNWRTAILGGLDDVQFISMAPSSKDMEYMSYSKMVALNLCSVFAINPEELGLEAISGQQRSSSNSENTEFKIEHSKERGLDPILRFFEELFNNEIIRIINKDFSNEYKLEFFFSEESPASFAALLQSEMTVNSSYNDVLRKSGKNIISHPIANQPLSQNFWALVEKNMTRGEIREIFLGDKGASDNPALQYIPGDPAFIQWQEFLSKQKEIKDQKEQQAQQMEAQQQQEQQQPPAPEQEKSEETPPPQ